MALIIFILSIKSISMFTNTNYIYDMVPLGNELIMTTSGGVVSYDINSDQFSVLNNSDGLPTNECYSIDGSINQDTTIWVGSRKGLTMITNSQILNYPLPIVVSSDIRTTNILGDTIFAGSSNGLAVIDTKGTPDFNDDYIYTIMRTHQLISDTVLSVNIGNKIWIGTDMGISRFLQDLTYDTSFTMSDGLPGPRIFSIFGRDSVFVGTDSGLALIKNDSISILKTGEEVRDITQLGDTIFFASSQGFGIYCHGSVWHENDSLPKKDIQAVEYINGKRWIGLGSGFDHDFWGEGFAYYDNYWRIIKNQGPNSNWISDIEIADNGDLFLSHGYRSWNHSKGASWFRGNSNWVNLNSTLPTTMDTMHLVHRLAKDHKGHIWFVMNWEAGLYFFDPPDSTWGYYDSLKTGIQILGSWDLDFDANDNMLVAVAWPPQSVGPALIDSNLERIIYLPGSDGFVVEVEVEDSSRYWIAYNSEGLELIEHNNTPFEQSDDQIHYFTSSEGLLSVNCRAAIADRKGGLYLLSEKGLTYIVKDASGDFVLTNFTSNNSPLSDNCKFYALTMDSQNRIWILSSIGLYYYDPDFNNWDVYYFSDLGLDLEFRDIEEFQNHAFKFDQIAGAIWFGSKNGLTKVDLQETTNPNLDSITIYPNPSTDGTTIFANLPDGAELTIFSLSGMKITKLENPDPVYKLIRWKWQDEDVRSGFYFVLIRASNGSKRVLKFAIVR